MGAVPALANPSIGKLELVGEVEVLRDDEHPLSDWIANLLDDGWYVIVREAHPELYTNEAVKKAVEAVNSGDVVETLENTLNDLKDFQPEDKEEVISALQGHDYIAQFSEVVLTNGEEYRFVEMDDEITVRAELTSDAIKGEKPENLEKYQIPLLNPNSGEVFTSAILEDSFDNDAGTFKTEFNALGAFTLVEK